MGSLPLWLSTTILGFGTVFIGLICLIFIVMLTSLVINKLTAGKTKGPVHSEETQVSSDGGIENRQEFVAAVSAAIATVMGKDVSGLRIKSIKKVS